MSNQLPSFLNASATGLLLFGGKGGVGKTTLSAATAIHWARQAVNKKILIASTDPAHSLGDSFNQQIGDSIVPLANFQNLFAMEMDAARRLDDFQKAHGAVLKKIMDRGTYFDNEDIDEFFKLSLPGMDELMAVIEIARIVREKSFDLVILDTAPTGHTLRMLSLPGLMEHWIEVLNLMLKKHRYMASTFGRYRPDDTDAFLVFMKSDLDLLESVLRDQTVTCFVPVMIPEAMCVAETTRLVAGLDELGIRVDTLLINHVVEPSGCPFCERRRQEQAPALEEIRRQFPNIQSLTIPLLSHPVRGQADLLEVGELLLGGRPALVQAPAHLPTPSGARPVPSFESLARTRLLLFGGKGGVGKTTIAAATAIHIAAKSNPSKAEKTLLFSTDPAHSLSDSLAQPIGNQVTQVTGVPGLFAIEMNSSELLEELNIAYIEEINEVFNSFMAGNLNLEFDTQVMEGLITLTPPGLDELMALMKIMDFMDEGEYDHYVLDMAPTGHALRFLETPAMVRAWFITFFKLLLKYQGIASLSKVAELLRQKSKQLRKVQQILLDPVQCQFVVVSIAEAMAVSETKRLVTHLAQLKIPSNLVVTNLLVPENDCPFCQAIRFGQQDCLKEIEALQPWSTRLQLSPEPIQGYGKLLQVAERLYGGQHG